MILFHFLVQNSLSSAYLASVLCNAIKVGRPSARVFYRGRSYLIVLGHESCKRMLFPYLDHMLLRLWQSPKEQSSKTLTCRTICGGGRLTELGHWARRRQSRWHSSAPLCITVSAWVGNRFISDDERVRSARSGPDLTESATISCEYK